MARKRIYTDEERKERLKEQKKRYNDSEKGMLARKKAFRKYQKTEKYKEYISNYQKNNN